MSAQTIQGGVRVRIAGRRDVGADGGRLASAGSAPGLLLSRLVQTGPLTHLPDEDDPDVVHVSASGAAADRDPSRVRSVLARPDDPVVEIGGTTVRAGGRLLLERHPRSAQEQHPDVRVTPVVALTPEQAS